MAETLRTLRLDAPLARGPPAPGFTLQAITAAGGIDLTWDGAPVANVQVMRSAAGPDGPFEAIAQTSSRSFEDRHLIPEIPYHYVVASAGAFSEPVEATPAAPSTTSGNLSVDLPASSASRLTLDLAPSLSPPPLAAGLTLLGSAFSIDATSLATGSAVHLLNETASVTFQVATGMQGPLTIYHWDGAGWAAMLLPRPSTCRRPSRAAPASSINARSASTATWASSTAECRTFCRRVGPGASVRPATNRSPSPTSSRRGPEHRPYST